jgi:YbgC/YbaW family acyl-CoA thioester hydrolase
MLFHAPTGVQSNPCVRVLDWQAAAVHEADQRDITRVLEGHLHLETSLSIIVRPTEVDVNGHVNNSKYVEYLEWGREEWYEHNGLPYDRLFALGAVTVTVNINLDFRRECRQGEALVIRTRPDRLGRTSFALRQEICKVDGSVAAEGTVTLVTIDPATRKSRPVPAELAAAFRP